MQKSHETLMADEWNLRAANPSAQYEMASLKPSEVLVMTRPDSQHFHYIGIGVLRVAGAPLDVTSWFLFLTGPFCVEELIMISLVLENLCHPGIGGDPVSAVL